MEGAGPLRCGCNGGEPLGRGSVMSVRYCTRSGTDRASGVAIMGQAENPSCRKHGYISTCREGTFARRTPGACLARPASQ